MKRKTLHFDINEYMPPDCSCSMEEKLKKNISGVREAGINPVSHIMKVVYDTKVTNADKILEFMKDCGYDCSVKHKDHAKMKHDHEMPSEHDRKDKEHGEHQGMDPSEHHAMMEKDFKKRTIVVLLVTIPVLLLSPTVQKWLNLKIPEFGFSTLLLFALASIIVIYGAMPFYKGAKKSLKAGILDMNVLVSLAVLSGYFYSVGSTFLFTAPDFYWEISTLVLFLVFGHWMEMKSIRGASGALKELVKLIPPKANLVKGKEIREVDTSQLKVGDIVLVKPGEKVPIDGEVVDGATHVNEAMITGESKPVAKKIGDKVIGGTINTDGSIKVKITKIGKDTALSQIIELVKNAQASKPKTQKLADRAAHYLTLTAIIVGLGTFFFWSFFTTQSFLFALTLAITVVVIACPHALGLAIPTVTAISTTKAAQHGMLVKDMAAMEVAKNLDIVVFDKTGTLTKGEFGVTDIITFTDINEAEVLGKAASVEMNSEHVIAKGILKEAKEKNLELPSVKEFKAISGKGARGIVENGEVFLGNRALMEFLKLDFTQAEKKHAKLSSQGKTVIYVSSREHVLGLIALADIIRDESKEAVTSLKSMGVEAAMLTGDNEKTAAYVARELGLDTFFADVLPGDKSEKIQELQNKGKIVAMVGDGVNDAPALTQADIGIAIGAGTDVAVESAEIVLVKNDPRDIAKLVRLSKRTMTKMKQNLAWATGYNAIAIPIAAGILYPWNIKLGPEWAALIMAASSIIVVTNAMMLKKEKLE